MRPRRFSSEKDGGGPASRPLPAVPRPTRASGTLPPIKELGVARADSTAPRDHLPRRGVRDPLARPPHRLTWRAPCLPTRDRAPPHETSPSHSGADSSRAPPVTHLETLGRTNERYCRYLDEDEVPDLEHVGVVHVHERGRVAAADAVEVDLGARAARAGVAHLPDHGGEMTVNSSPL